MKKRAGQRLTGPHSRLSIVTKSYELFLLPSVAHPPLPLQEFLPLQPLSPVLHPPLPLQAFLPEQAFVSAARLCMLTPALTEEVAALRCETVAPDKMPAIAAPTISLFECFMFI